MRKAMMAMLLAIAASNAAAAWVEVSNNEDMTSYIDPATLRRSGNIVKVWELYSRKTPRTLGATTYMSVRSQTDPALCPRAFTRKKWVMGKSF